MLSNAHRDRIDVQYNTTLLSLSREIAFYTLVGGVLFANDNDNNQLAEEMAKVALLS